MSIKQLWCEKYRPQKISEYVFHNEIHKSQIMHMISEKEVPNLLFSGVQGSGKTTLAKILIRELDVDDTVDLLTINGSEENGVDMIRDKIKNFSYGYSIGRFKIVFIDEADYLSANAQAILRGLIEEVSDSCRFILTCNYLNKIIPALRSRFQEYNFQAPDKADVVQYAATILMSEKIDFDVDDLLILINSAYPDIRKIVYKLQQFSHSGKLVLNMNETDSSDYKFKIIDVISSGDFKALRKLVCENVPKEEYEEVYRVLYDNLHKAPKFNDIAKYEKGIVTIANYLYRNTLIADTEINAAAMFIELGNI